MLSPTGSRTQTQQCGPRKSVPQCFGLGPFVEPRLLTLLPLCAEVQVSILSDCVTAIGITEGTAGQFRGLDLAANCRHARQAVRARAQWDSVSVCHVRSHVGNVGNEAADYLAKASCRATPRVAVWQNHPICTFLQQGWLTWLWIYIAAFSNPIFGRDRLGGPSRILRNQHLPFPHLRNALPCLG